MQQIAKTKKERHSSKESRKKLALFSEVVVVCAWAKICLLFQRFADSQLHLTAADDAASFFFFSPAASSLPKVDIVEVENSLVAHLFCLFHFFCPLFSAPFSSSSLFWLLLFFPLFFLLLLSRTLTANNTLLLH